MSFVAPTDDALKEQGIIDKTDPNNPVYCIRYNNRDHRVSLLAVQPDKRDWFVGNLNKIIKDIIADAVELGDSGRLKQLHEALKIR